MIKSKLKPGKEDVLEGSIMLKDEPEEDYSGRADPGLGLEDFSPVGDVKAGLEAISEGDIANLALATASLLLPGTIRIAGKGGATSIPKGLLNARKRVVPELTEELLGEGVDDAVVNQLKKGIRQQSSSPYNLSREELMRMMHTPKKGASGRAVANLETNFDSQTYRRHNLRNDQLETEVENLRAALGDRIFPKR